MSKRILAIAAVAVLAACGPEPQSASQNGADPAANNPPSAASASTSYNNLAPLPGASAQSAQAAPRTSAPAAPAPAQLAAAPAPAPAADVPAASPPPAPATAAAAGCQDCGVIAAITPEQHQGKPGWVGTLGGGAAGGLIGNQFGRGSGNVAMTVVGVVGGALAGREVEKRVTTTTVYRVDVTMANGGTRTLTLHKAEGLSVGERVRVHRHRLVPY